MPTDAASLCFRDPALQARFERDGYAVLPILSADEAARAERLARATFGTAARPMAARTDFLLYNSIFDSVTPGRQASEAVLRDMVLPTANRLFHPFTVLEKGMMIKPAGFRGSPLHLHPPLTAQPFGRSIVMWCALHDIGQDSACLRIVPASQRLFRYVNTRDVPVDWLDRNADQILAEFAIDVPLKAGEAVLFDNVLWHGSHANAGSVDRMAFAMLFGVTGSQMVEYRRDSPEQMSILPVQSLNEAHEVDCTQRQPDIAIMAAIRTLPVWQNDIGMVQIRALLTARGPRASEDYNPLETVAHLADPPTAQAAAHGLPSHRAVPAGRRARLLTAGRSVPGLARTYRLARRMFNRLT